MIGRLKKAIGSYWARSRAFRIVIIAAFFLFMAVPIFLLYWYTRTLLGHSVDILIIIVILVFGYVTRKKGRYVEQASPKMRRLQCVVSGGLLTGFAIPTILRVLFGPPPSSHFFLLFLVLIAVGAYIGDMVGRKLRWY